MHIKYDYKNIINKNIKEIQDSFITQKIIKKKLIPFYRNKPTLLLNNSDKISSKKLNEKDDITKRNNNQYEEKIYDGQKLSKAIHKKLEYFNRTHKKNISLYKHYKSKSVEFSKYYYFCKNFNKSSNFDDFKEKYFQNEAMVDLINDYKLKKNYSIEMKSFNKDIFNNSALIENKINELKFLYIFNPYKFGKKSKSETERNKKIKFDFSKPYVFDMDSIKHLKEYKFIKKIKLLSKKKLESFYKKSFNVKHDISNISSVKFDNDLTQKMKSKDELEIIDDKNNNNSELIKEEILKNKNDIDKLNQTIKSINDEMYLKRNNSKDFKMKSNKKYDFSSIHNSNTSRDLKVNKSNNIMPYFTHREKINKSNYFNFGKSTDNFDELNQINLFPKIKNINNDDEKNQINNIIINKIDNNTNKLPRNKRRNSVINLNKKIVINRNINLIKSKTINNLSKQFNDLSQNNISIYPSRNELENLRQENGEPKTEYIYKIAKENVTNYGNKKVIEKIENFLEHKNNIYKYKNNNRGNYFKYLKNLSNKISQYDIKDRMKKTYNVMGQRMLDDERSKIKEISNLEDSILKKGKELLYSLLLKKSKVNSSQDEEKEDN